MVNAVQMKRNHSRLKQNHTCTDPLLSTLRDNCRNNSDHILTVLLNPFHCPLKLSLVWYSGPFWIWPLPTSSSFTSLLSPTTFTYSDCTELIIVPLCNISVHLASLIVSVERVTTHPLKHTQMSSSPLVGSCAPTTLPALPLPYGPDHTLL